MRSTSVLLGATKRIALNSKHGKKNFYKGRGAPSMGRLDKHARFVPNYKKQAHVLFTAPDLTDFKLKAYVNPTTPLVPEDIIPPITSSTDPILTTKQEKVLKRNRKRRARKIAEAKAE